jgi:hypothetical protein
MPATQITWVGLDMKLYRNTGTFGTPVWTLVNNVQDLKRGSALGEAELNNRASALVLKEPTLNEYVFNWGMIKDELDTNYTGLRTAKDARTLVEFAFANGLIATSGTTYFRIETKLFGFDDEEPLSGGVVTSVTAKPCKSSNAPSWNIVP